MVGNIRHALIRLTDDLELVAPLETGIEDIVDGRVAGHLAPVVPGLVVVRHLAGLAGILHQGAELVQAGIVRIHVHVARKDHRETVRIHRADAFHQQKQTLPAGFLAHVVQVRVHEKERALGHLVIQERPGGGPAARGIPALGRLERRLGQPIGPPFLQVDASGVIEHRHMLAVADAVLTAHADVLVSGAMLFEPGKLEVQGLLNAEHGGMLVVDHRAGRVAAVRPDIVTVLGRPVADVEGHHGKRLSILASLAGESQERQQGRQ